MEIGLEIEPEPNVKQETYSMKKIKRERKAKVNEIFKDPIFERDFIPSPGKSSLNMTTGEDEYIIGGGKCCTVVVTGESNVHQKLYICNTCNDNQKERYPFLTREFVCYFLQLHYSISEIAFA